MSWLATAIGGSALIQGAASYLGSRAQADAANNALQFQQGVYAHNQAQIQPFVGGGTDAMGQLRQSYVNPGSFLTSPDYQFAYGQGLNALQNSAAARGGLLGGNFARGAQEYGQGFATNYLDRYRKGLLDQASLGANAASGSANNAAYMSNLIGNTYGNIGAANASGWVGGANAATSGIQNYLFMNGLNRSSYGGGGGFGGGGGS